MRTIELLKPLLGKIRRGNVHRDRNKQSIGLNYQATTVTFGLRNI
jgi:hypothetical protein